MTALVDNLLVFGRLLRAVGLDVQIGRLLDIAEALPQVDIGRRDDVYHTCRALLVHRHDDLAPFDRAFAASWRVHRVAPQPANRRPDRDPPKDGPQTVSLGLVEMSGG